MRNKKTPLTGVNKKKLSDSNTFDTKAKVYAFFAIVNMFAFLLTCAWMGGQV